jgi:hypothetical protein
MDFGPLLTDIPEKQIEDERGGGSGCHLKVKIGSGRVRRNCMRAEATTRGAVPGGGMQIP